MPRATKSAPAKKTAPAKAAPAKKAPAKKAAPAAANGSELNLTELLERLAQAAVAVEEARLLVATNGRKKAAAAATVVEEEPEEEEEAEEGEESEERAERRAELEGMNDRQLRTIAKSDEYGFDAAAVKDADRQTLIDSILSADFEEEAEEGEDEEVEEEAEEEAEELSREQLLGLSLVELKNVAVEQGVVESKNELRGKDKDAIADLILGPEEEEEDEEGEFYTREDYEAMSPKELMDIADEYGIKYRKGAKHSTLVDLLVAADEEEEEE